MEINRNFYNEINTLLFKPLNYTLFNIIEEDYFIYILNKMDNANYSIDDFSYAMFELNEKEKFLLKMWNKKYLENIKQLEKDIEYEPHAKVYVNHEYGSVIIIKLNTVKLKSELL